MKAIRNEVNKLEDVALSLMSSALKAGAEQAEVCARFGQKTKITLEKQDYHLASTDHGFEFGLRILIGNHQGFTSCNTTDPTDLKDVALRAVEIAGFSPENSRHQIFASENIHKNAPTSLWNEQLATLSLRTQKEWSKCMVEEATKDTRFRLNEGSVSIGSGVFLVINSKGTHKLLAESAASWGLMGMGVEGQNITSFDYFHDFTRSLENTPEKIVTSTRQFRDKLLQSLISGSAKSYKGLVAFSPRAVTDIFLPAISYQLNGRCVAEGTGRWKLDHLNTKVLNSHITLEDLPWLQDRTSCATFDREGTPTSNRTTVEKGELKTFLLDHYAAKALGLKSTGNASGTATSTPTVNVHCLCMQGGETPQDSLMQLVQNQRKAFLWVNRYSGQVDPVTGDFSGVAKGADWWEDGQRKYCVKETLISGNVFEALGEGLFGLSKETTVVDAFESCPTLVCDGISVTTG